MIGSGDGARAAYAAPAALTVKPPLVPESWPFTTANVPASHGGLRSVAPVGRLVSTVIVCPR